MPIFEKSRDCFRRASILRIVCSILFGGILLLVSLSNSLFAQKGPITWQDIPNVQLQDSTQYVSDPARLIPDTEREEINQIFRDLRRSKGVEGVVIILPTMGSEGTIEGLALDVLRGWGVGAKEDNNGFVILVVIDRRQARIETGYGLEGILPDALCSDIIVNRMLPYFREKAYGQGLLTATQEIQNIILAGYEGGGSWLETPNVPQGGGEAVMFTIISTLILMFFILRGMIGVGQKCEEYSPRKQQHRLRQILITFIIVALPLSLGSNILITLGAIGVVLIFYFIQRSSLLRKVKICPTCGAATYHSLPEKVAKKHLTANDLLEMKLGSVVHTLCVCDTCGTMKHYREPSNTTLFRECPRCHTWALTLDSVSKHPLSTRSHTYIERKHYYCIACDHHMDEDKMIKKEDNAQIVGFILGQILGGALRTRGGSGGGFGGGFGGGSGGGGGATGGW